ncbi:LPXTG cell wall anchor domain-containing protein [Streptomyces sp. NPDC047981]|uniref:LPXTG cell wall anchor domain-containing protein n=1 Tax=Streptomyces sp. NPDC047981 TaxID=3154610 RepID=UPI003414DF30
MRRSLIPAGALVAAMAGSLVLAPAAFAADGPSTLPLHQAKDLPLAAGDFETQEKTCADIPATQDGWHFVLPGSGKGESAVFTKLTVEFQPGGVQTITVFGPPSDKHAYVSSEPGAKLISATAEVKGEVKKEWFNLSHTCPASVTPTPSQSTTGTPSVTPSTSTSTSPSTSVSPSTSTSPSTGATPSASDSASAGATPSASSGGSSEGDLAETGSSAPVGIIAAFAVALAGAGAFLVTRRRKAQQH